MERDNKLMTVRYTDPDFMILLQDAVENGYPVLLEGVQEELDPGLESILLR